MKIGITGARGFVGSNLSRIFSEKGWQVQSIGRKELALSDRELADQMSDIDVMINLAGANIARRWNTAYKNTIYDSRIGVTQKLIAAMTLMAEKPKTFISASAIGIYNGTEKHTEASTSFADDFLALTCKDWEKEAKKAEAINTRTVIFRFGIVLGKGGGMLKKMLLPFKMGMGGTIGNGRQFFSWIHIEDLGNAMCRAISDENIQSTYNLTAPNPVTNKELTKTLARQLRRPAFFPLPLFFLRIIFSEGSVAISSGQYALPKRLIEEGFDFRFPTLKEALHDILSS